MSFQTPTLVKEHRKANYPIHPLILSRYSPRAMSDEKISKEQLMSLFEAARWAPSSSNKQPWTFLYAQRDSQYWQDYFDLLIDFNKAWAKNAATLIIITAKTEENGEKLANPDFDAGAAWENLALEATSQGLIAHGIGGFDHQKAAKVVSLPENYKIIAMIAIGKPGSLDQIDERMHKQEIPNQRKSLDEVAREGEF